MYVLVYGYLLAQHNATLQLIYNVPRLVCYQTHTQLCIYNNMYACTHKQTYIYTYIYIHVYVHTCIHAYNIFTCKYTYIHTYIHTYIYTYIRTFNKI